MRITLYFINWDDSFYIPFLHKHYSQFCQKMVMYDGFSSDGSQDIATKLGIEVREFGRPGVLDDEVYRSLKNNCWKEERGKSDYVIICDADEFVLPDKLIGTAPVVKGFNMISEHLPVNDIFEINTGSESESYSKQAIFSPTHIDEINYVHGCHKNHISGTITTSGHCRLLHFRQIGGVERMIARHSDYRERMSKFNLRHGMGVHYLATDEQKRIEWAQLQAASRKLW